MSTAASCTTSILLAAEAPIGVVVRRGPSRWFQIIRWDTSNDTFEDGQWHKGRFYPEHSDLSPDGALLLYLAMNAHWGEAGGCWLTAISRVPYLRPLISWDRGLLSGGGGRFLSNCFAMTPDGVMALPRPGCAGITFPEQASPPASEAPYGDPSPDGVWELDRAVEPERVLYRIRRVADNTMIPLTGATSAGWDRSGRLVYSRGSVLMAARFSEQAWDHTPIADFDDGRVPNPSRAPERAGEW